jgi:predicted transposase/invertase (TIGR01784 family)
MDFHVRINGQADVIIEMQVQRHAMFDERALYYAAYTYSHQLTDEEIRQEN